MLNFKNADQSLWQHTAIKPFELQQLQGAIKADVTIIGAGYTGLRTALELAQKGVNVIVIDAHQPGWGASGRSGGQVNPLAHDQPTKIIEELGSVYGPRMLNSYIHSADELFDLIHKHGLKCDSARNGWLRTAHCRSAIPELQKMGRYWADIGLDIENLEGDQLHQITGSSAYSYALQINAGGSVHPLSYTRELARVAMKHGAQIFSDSRANNIKRKEEKWELTTDLATIDSEWVVFCTNGYTDNTLKGLRQTVIPLISIQAATRELTDEEYSQVLPQGHTFSDTRRALIYGRKDNRNRVLLGGSGNSELCEGNDRHKIHNAFKAIFPQFTPEDIEFYWGGRIAYTKDVLPHLHEPAPGVLAGLGYSGRGVAMGTVMGRILAERVLGKDPKALEIPTTPYKTFAFHRFHQVGVNVATKYYEVRDALDMKFS